MKLSVKVKFRGQSETVEVTADTMYQCKEKAIMQVVKSVKNVAHSDCEAEVTRGLPTTYVSQLIKSITRRRMTAEQIEPYATSIGCEKTYSSGQYSYKWSEEQVEQLKEMLKNEL